jgi:hypothetical protein
MIAAPPGWYLAIFIEAGAGWPARLDEEPIVAWEIERRESRYRGERHIDRSPIPIVLNLNITDVETLGHLFG